ncbi:hypothetical protein CRUP_032241 [Coryphaenoides rupestris]|nr:hypothetical protein CRUP_032241 [Coryphaenoides rupestris]
MGAHGADWPEANGQNPWNLMIKHRQVHRRGRRSHMVVSFTEPGVSMDLLRAVLQPSFNDDIIAVFRKYQQFLDKAAENVKENVGDDVPTDQLVTDTCRNLLEHAKQMFPEAESKTRPGAEVNLKVRYHNLHLLSLCPRRAFPLFTWCPSVLREPSLCSPAVPLSSESLPFVHLLSLCPQRAFPLFTCCPSVLREPDRPMTMPLTEEAPSRRRYFNL